MGKAKKRTPAQLRYIAIDRILRTKLDFPLRRTFDEIVNGVNNQVPRTSIDYPEWSIRQIRRDFSKMREVGAPIATQPHKDAYGDTYEIYYYADPNYSWPDIGFDQADLQALKLAGALLSPYENLPAIRHLIDLAEKTEQSIEADRSKHHDVPIYFSPLADNKIDPDVWATVLDASTRKKMLAITYTGWKGQSPKTVRRFSPYAIIQLEGEWYVVGTAQLLDNTIRQYKMSRILSAKVIKASFQVPSDFKAHELLENTFGKFLNKDDLVTVRVRFRKKVATQVLGQKWHPKQKTKAEKNGDVTISFKVTRSAAGPEWVLYHVKSWVLSWGANAEVLAPKELRVSVQSEVDEMIRNRKEI